MSAIHVKTIKGREYAYDVTSYWDKELKKRRKKTKYIGRIIDKENGVYEKLSDRNKNINDNNNTGNKIDNDKSTSLIMSFGDTFCMMEYFKKSPHYEVFKGILPEYYDTLMCLIYYKLLRSSAMQHAGTWLRGNYAGILHKNADLSSQRISDFLKMLGSEIVWRSFFKDYLNKTIEGRPDGEKAGIIIDSTGLPNEIDFPLSAWGHHGGESERETRLLMVVDSKNGMPLYFRYMAGNIIDVSTLTGTIAELVQFGVNTAFALLDAGYYSEDNIKDLYQSKIAFLTRLPARRRLYQALIENHSDDLETVQNIQMYGKRMLYVKQVQVDLFGNAGFAYIVCDVKRKADEMAKYMLGAKEDGLADEQITKDLLYKGKLVLISSVEIPLNELIPLYYTRQSAENLFGIFKDCLDILPLRVHSVETFRGYLLLNFLSLIVHVGLKKKLSDKYTVEGALLEMSNLMCKIFNKKTLVMEPTKKMKDICSLLGVVVPKCLGE